MDSPRYLVPFNTRNSLHAFADVLVVGAGIAGIRAALEIPDDLSVLVINKAELQESNSAYAQGGIAGVLAEGDTFQNHIEDTHVAGAGLCDPAVVDLVVREAPGQIRDLVRFGTDFDRVEGKLALTREGGHSHRRIVHALGDATGHEVMRALIAKARDTANINLWPDTFTIDLLTVDNACVGALVHRKGVGNVLIWAKQVILASGGCGMVYRETTNPHVATGDGMAAAHRAGGELRDMEFMQFHPTVLYVAGSARFLISEAVRGEGAHLLDVRGERFMLAEDPRGELAPRDVVSQAIFRTMERTQHPNVYLDLSHLDPAMVLERFPGINRMCRGFGLNITKDRIPVRPGAHYMIGGLSVNLTGQTTVPNLWAAGEVTSSGLHGANRLASNSLIEGLVYGTLCARGAAEAARKMPRELRALPLEFRVPGASIETLDVEDVTNSLRSLMVRNMGIVRERTRLLEARESVEFWCRYVLNRHFENKDGWELQNLLTVARMMIESAILREESRGTHFRSDFPNRDDVHWKRHILSPARTG